MSEIEYKIYLTEAGSVDDLLSLLHFEEEEIIRSHFYIDEQDVEYSKNIDWRNYFSSPSTGYIYLKEIFLGAWVQNVMIILSGNLEEIEVSIEFENDEIDEELLEKFTDTILSKNSDLKVKNVDYTVE